MVTQKHHFGISRIAALLGLCACVAVPMVSAAYANQPLRTLRAREAAERELDQEAGFTGKVCGTSISTRIDWATAADWPENANIAKACDGALGALEAICRSDRSRGSRITSFVCSGDGSGPDLSGSTLYYGATPGQSGFDETKSFLEGEL